MKKTLTKEVIRELGSAEKTIVIEMLQEQINLQKEEINRLKVKLKNLEGQIAKNSKNSRPFNRLMHNCDYSQQ